MGRRNRNQNNPAADLADADAAAAYEAAAMNAATDTAPTTEEDPEIAELLESVGVTETPPADPVTVTVETADATVTVTVEPTDGVEPADDATAEVIEMEEPEVDVDSVLAEVQSEDDAAAAAATPAATGTKRARKAATPKPAVVTREFSEVASISRDDFVARIDAPETAKKIAEKAKNLLDAVEKGHKLSRYTKVAVKTLAANGKVSGKSLVEAFEAEGLKLGTARAQGQQMTSLFKISGICTPDASNARELIVADQKFVDELALLAA